MKKFTGGLELAGQQKTLKSANTPVVIAGNKTKSLSRENITKALDSASSFLKEKEKPKAEAAPLQATRVGQPAQTKYKPALTRKGGNIIRGLSGNIR